MDVDLSTILRIIATAGVVVQVENRHGAGWHSYGFPHKHLEVLGYRNTADNDLWDGLVLGYTGTLPYGQQFFTNQAIGVLLVEGGNHKILFKIPRMSGFSARRFAVERQRFLDRYRRKWGLRVAYRPLV